VGQVDVHHDQRAGRARRAARRRATPVNQHINWYQSYHRLEGRQLPDGSYVYVDGYVGGVPKWVPDVGGAADRKHLADLHGNVPEIAPLG
jgi:hypothetical protein